ncbi:hypothetical protein KY312_03845 [Candidatus Woesearchaeota archaeon]|nr:hypothetical protein [Candidatus Woesearchaeota archaeon]
MKKNWLFWLPRILAIIYILFISMFALDIFAEYSKISEILIGLFMHLIPSFILIGSTVLAWKKEKLGGIVFIVLSIAMAIFFNRNMEPMGFLIISLPVLMIGVLFLLDNYLY